MFNCWVLRLTRASFIAQCLRVRLWVTSALEIAIEWPFCVSEVSGIIIVPDFLYFAMEVAYVIRTCQTILIRCRPVLSPDAQLHV